MGNFVQLFEDPFNGVVAQGQWVAPGNKNLLDIFIFSYPIDCLLDFIARKIGFLDALDFPVTLAVYTNLRAGVKSLENHHFYVATGDQLDGAGGCFAHEIEAVAGENCLLHAAHIA